MTITTQKQIDVRNINGVRGKFKKVESKQHIARIIGFAHYVDEKPGADLSTTLKFTGEFLAVNQEGEQFLAPSLVLPPQAGDALQKALVAADRSVQFGFDFHLVPKGDKGGYALETSKLIEIEPSGALSTLADLVEKRHPVKGGEPDNAVEPNNGKRTPK